MIGLETPGALWGLGSLVLLILFSVWRGRPASVPVGSLVLWRRVPDRAPPLRSAGRPRITLPIVLLAGAVASLVGALAGPYAEEMTPEPLRLAVLVDTSARMSAVRRDGRRRFEAAISSARTAAERLTRRDRVRIYWAERGTQVWEGKGEEAAGVLARIRPVHHRVDMASLLALALRRNPEETWIVSDRELEGAPASVRRFLAGEERGNVGIVHASLEGQELFVRLRTVGEATERDLLVFRDGQRAVQERLSLREGDTVWWRRIPAENAARVEIRLLPADPLRLDDTVVLQRASRDRSIRLEGTRHPLLERVLQSVPGVAIGGGNSAVLYRTLEGAGERTVYLDPPGPPPGFRLGQRFTPRRWTTTGHPLTAHLRADDFSADGAREVVGGTPLLFADGRCVAALRDGAVVLAFELAPDGWAATPSFPIFWTNVLDYVTNLGRWEAPVAGRVLRLPPDTEGVEPISRSAIYSYDPSADGFLPETVGEYVVKTSRTERRIAVNLLDEEESDIRGVERRDDGVARRSESRSRRSLSAYLCYVALALVLLSWVSLPRRGG